MASTPTSWDSTIMLPSRSPARPRRAVSIRRRLYDLSHHATHPPCSRYDGSPRWAHLSWPGAGCLFVVTNPLHDGGARPLKTLVAVLNLCND